MYLMNRTFGATLALASLAITTPAAASEGLVRCASPAAGRLACDEDGCVRLRLEADCLLLAASPPKTRARRDQTTLQMRQPRDEVALLLARLQ